VIELELECDIRIEVIACAKAWAISETHVRQCAARICIEVLKAEKWPHVPDLLRNLGVGAGHVEHIGAAGLRMPNENAFVQELQSMLNIYDVRIQISTYTMCAFKMVCP